VHVVAVKGDVELAEGDLRAAQLLDALPQPLRKGDAARVDADERDALQVGVALDDFVRDPRQRAPDRIGVEDRARCRGFRGYGPLRANLTADSFPASRDRVKGVRLGARAYRRGRTEWSAGPGRAGRRSGFQLTERP
jgi:hypothetical protein